jgi:uncharacterized membrane protein HdeD (DUF308 family)
MSRTLYIVAGIISLIAGVLALFDPFGATFAATLIAGWGFILFGLLQFVAAFQASGWGGRIWSFLLGILTAVVGVQILANPLGGMVSLTLMLAILMIASGIAKLLVSWPARNSQYFWPLLISGAASLLLGFIILRHFDTAVPNVLGLLLGIELLSNGVASIAFAWLTRDRSA